MSELDVTEQAARKSAHGAVTLDAVQELIDAAGGGAALYSPDIPYATPSAEDDEFNGGALDPKWSALGTIPPITWGVPSCIGIVPDYYAALSAIVQPAGDVTRKWRMKIFPARGVATASQVGLCMKRAGVNYVRTWGIETTNNTFRSAVRNNGSIFTEGSLGTAAFALHRWPAFYFELAYTAGTHLCTFSASEDGVNFLPLATDVDLGGSPDYVGIFADGGGGAAAKTHQIDWFRRVQGTGTGVEF